MFDRVTDWPLPLGYETEKVRAADGTRLRVVATGPKGARRVVLLHGMPQTSYAFRHVIPFLAGRYRVIVPDLRGTGASDLAENGDYGLETLAGDVGAVLDATGEGPALVTGHDWGGAIAWAFATRFPARVRHIIAVNGPHPAAYAREMLTRAQASRAVYIGLFHLPGAARLLSLGRAWSFGKMIEGSSAPLAFSKVDLDLYRDAYARPGRAEALIAYYKQVFGGRRALEKRREIMTTWPRTDVPATVLWGEDDQALAPSHPDAIRPYASRLEIRRLPGVSHWVPEERPEEVARAIREADGVS